MYNSNSKQLYAIMIVFIALFLHAQPVVAAELPELPPAFYYYDETGILTPETKELIMDVNDAYEQTAEKPQIVVAVIDSLNGETIEDYSVNLFEKWNIGNADYDNGVLILLATDEREIRLEVGYGLEGL